MFAILGLRAMRFLLAGTHERFHLLSLKIPSRGGPQSACPFAAKHDDEQERQA